MAWRETSEMEERIEFVLACKSTPDSLPAVAAYCRLPALPTVYETETEAGRELSV